MSDTPPDIKDGDIRTAFTLLVRTVERLEDKLDQGIEAIGEVKREQVAQGLVGEQTLVQATKTNGRMDRAEQWQRDHEGVHGVAERAAGREQGYDDRKADEVAMLRKVGAMVGKWGPYGLLVLLAGIGIRIGAWFVGGAW